MTRPTILKFALTSLCVSALAASIAATAAFAAADAVVSERHKHFEDIGKSVKEPLKMFKGEAKFEMAPVQAALKTMQEKSALLPKLFPDDSKKGKNAEGKETRALPAIWDNKADFEERMKKLGDDAKKAETAITDEASFKTTFKDVMGNCSGCHKKYRKEEE
jgi:cytochrome c556